MTDPHHTTEHTTLYHGNNMDVLPTLPDNSIDAVITDPPYELGFMGKKWDATGIAYSVDLWAEVLRVLKPGGHLCAFGGTRTYHRMTCAIEDAGFEIRDSLHWIYGSGFPKSLNLKDDWDGWGTALKPAHEPIVLARKPLTGTVAQNVLQHGTGALNIDACRIGGDAGRWPANVIFDEHAAAELDQQSGIQKDGVAVQRNKQNVNPSTVTFASKRGNTDIGYGGQGGASRFFYCAKPSRAERNAGLDGMPEAMPLAPNGAPNAVGTTRGSLSQPRANFHPTVKPIALMQWLIRLVTPPGGTILDPFAGSGTTLAAATLTGHHAIGIELTDDYLPIITARCNWAETQTTQRTPTLFDTE